VIAQKPQLAAEASHKRLGLFRDIRRPAVNDQENLVLGPDYESPDKINKDIGIHAARDREPHMTARGDG
jgi:hypothetical protein